MRTGTSSVATQFIASASMDSVSSFLYLVLIELFTWLLALWYFTSIIYHSYVSSIADIPAPHLVASVSNLWKAWQNLKGDTARTISTLQKQHGPFVRIGHDEVSVYHLDAVRLIRSFIAQSIYLSWG